MKLFMMLSTLLFCYMNINADPLLVAVLMVKNEASVMEMTLQPLVDAGIKDFLMYDTGSTDDTIKITQEFFIKNSISNFVIVQGDWVDFSTSRNRALELTEQYFPDATFMLMLDAEWILHNGADLLAYCQKYKNDSEQIYFIKLIGSDMNFYPPRLIRCKSNIFFVGKIHEMLNIVPKDKQLPDHIYFSFNPTRFGQEKSQARWLKDRDIFLQELQKNPDDARMIFFLGQTYLALSDFSNAINWLLRRSMIISYDEEYFLTLCFLAQAYGAIADSKKMVAMYLQAYNVRPYRAEPLVLLAQYYYSIQAYHLCYLFARHAATLPYPKDDLSLVDGTAYNFLRYALVSATAHLFGDLELGKQATLKALAARPDQQYLIQNLHYYESMFT